MPQCRIAFPGDLRLVSRQTGSTSCPGPILSGSEGPRGHKAVPGAPARARSPAGWTCSPGPHALTSRSLWGRPAELGAWGPGPNALGIDQLSQVTGARVRMPVESTTFPETRHPVGGSAWSTRLSGDSGPCPRAHSFDQHPGRLWTVLGAAVLNSCPRELVLGPRAPGVDQRSRATPVQVRGPTVSTSSPGDSCSVLRAREFDPMSSATRARFQRPAGSTRSHGHLGTMPEAPGVNQMSPATPARLRVPAGSTSPPGRLALWSQGPWF